MAIILFRSSPETQEEVDVAFNYLPLTFNRTLCSYMVIGRYSVLPYYQELEIDLGIRGAWLVNSYKQHRWVANFDYYDDLKEFTPETWFDLRDVPDQGQFVVKGRTNSRKHRWDTMMFARSRTQAVEIAHELLDDPLISSQGIVVRRYVPLEFLEEGINGQPFVNEHRIFYYGATRLAHGFYWVQTEKQGEIDQEGLDFADKVAKIVAKNINFFVLDVARTQEGKWILVEVNDGQMSGLSNVDPAELYSNLRREVVK